MATRYLEEVDYADVAAATLAKVWSGVEEESDGLSVHRERLELRADGSFTHTLAHTFALSKRASGEHDESSCVGHWRVFKVRHLGADVDAAADREIGFSRGSGSPPLLTEKIVVCGVNPHVNGFLGASCRLYPEASRLGVASTPPSQDAPRRSHPGGARHCASPPEDHEDANATELQPSDSEVRQLAEATGRPPDECLAALLHHGGSIEEAASRLCEGVESEAGDPAATNGAGIESAARTVSPTMAEVIALERQSEARSQEGQRLAEATGRTLQECLQALAAHNGRIDDAAAELLSLVHSDDDGGAPRPAPERGQLEGVDELRGPGAGGGGGAAAEGGAPEGGAAEGRTGAGAGAGVVAARLAEITGRPLAMCLEALQSCGGRGDDAAAQLLALEDEAGAGEHGEPEGDHDDEAEPKEGDADDMYLEAASEVCEEPVVGECSPDMGVDAGENAGGIEGAGGTAEDDFRGLAATDLSEAAIGSAVTATIGTASRRSRDFTYDAQEDENLVNEEGSPRKMPRCSGA